jgi:hypothetical protein
LDNDKEFIWGFASDKGDHRTDIKDKLCNIIKRGGVKNDITKLYFYIGTSYKK